MAPLRDEEIPIVPASKPKLPDVPVGEKVA